MKADLILEDGTIFSGSHIGAHREVVCEVVFNTGNTGYLELLTDASYAGQGLIMTSPMIGNYGVFSEQSESGRPWAAALLVRDLSRVSDDERGAEDLIHYLVRHQMPGLTELDTRSLTLHLRKFGTMRGMITDGAPYQLDQCLEKIRQYQNRCPVAAVSTDSHKAYPAGASPVQPDKTTRLQMQQTLPYKVNQLPPPQPAVYNQNSLRPARYRVALLDFGVKQHIIWHLTKRDCQVDVFPWQTSAAEILQSSPDGLVLSNGPGDPQDCRAVLQTIKSIYDANLPILAICLGHQLLGMAHGAKTKRLKYGHRGVNHPVKDMADQRIVITSQNHGYVIMEETINSDVSAVSHIHLNDGSVEGLRYFGKPVISVQFHPEGAPGPQDSAYLFDEWIRLIELEKEGTNA